MCTFWSCTPCKNIKHRMDFVVTLGLVLAYVLVLYPLQWCTSQVERPTLGVYVSRQPRPPKGG